jgi:hypothetical protein
VGEKIDKYSAAGGGGDRREVGERVGKYQVLNHPFAGRELSPLVGGWGVWDFIRFQLVFLRVEETQQTRGEADRYMYCTVQYCTPGRETCQVGLGINTIILHIVFYIYRQTCINRQYYTFVLLYTVLKIWQISVSKEEEVP